MLRRSVFGLRHACTSGQAEASAGVGDGDSSSEEEGDGARGNAQTSAVSAGRPQAASPPITAAVHAPATDAAMTLIALQHRPQISQAGFVDVVCIPVLCMHCHIMIS